MDGVVVRHHGHHQCCHEVIVQPGRVKYAVSGKVGSEAIISSAVFWLAGANRPRFIEQVGTSLYGIIIKLRAELMPCHNAAIISLVVTMNLYSSPCKKYTHLFHKEGSDAMSRMRL